PDFGCHAETPQNLVRPFETVDGDVLTDRQVVRGQKQAPPLAATLHGFLLESSCWFSSSAGRQRPRVARWSASCSGRSCSSPRDPGFAPGPQGRWRCWQETDAPSCV